VIALTAILTPEVTGDAAGLAPASEPGALAVHVAFQLADCASALAFLDILDHPTVADRMNVASLVFVGEAADTAAAARALGGKFSPLTLASARMLREFRDLGFRRTPFLVVKDADGATRFAAPVPRDPLELRSLHWAMVGLADLHARRTASGRQ
jgi:hypothetical protein